MTGLDDRGFVSNLDASNMLRFISDLPDQCREAYKIGRESEVLKPDHNVSNIVFAGLGGSAIGADIVKVYLQNELKVPMVVSRNYTLPDFVGKDTLLFCSSYSGNTEETLSSFNDGRRRGAYIITIGSGGRLKELSVKNGFRHIGIPSGFPPRAAVGYMSITVLAILAKLGFVNDKEEEVGKIYSALSELRDKEIGIDIPSEKNISKKLAAALFGKYCIVYSTSDSTDGIGLRWREQLAENSKSLSSSHVIPEMNHNEIVGWEFPKELLKDFKVIILRDRNDHARTQARIEISKMIIKQSGAEVFELEREGAGLLVRLFSLLYIGDFVSFYLAILNNVDPTPVRGVEYLKAELAKV